MTSPARSGRALTIVGIALVALAISVVAILLAQWQWGRHVNRTAELQAYEAGQNAAPAPLSEVVPEGATEFPTDAQWKTAVTTGSFDAESLTWLRNRPVGGSPASHALVWFVTDDGRALLVDAGWVDADAAQRPTVPTDTMTITVTMRPTEPDDRKGTDTASRITPAQMPPAPASTVPGYGVLAQACQEPCGPLPGLKITPLPQLGLGAHLAYTVQWYLLAIAAPIVAIVWIRRELRNEAPTNAAKATSLRLRRDRSDEEVEDAL